MQKFFLELRESIFLSIANNLPRLNYLNKFRYKLLKNAGFNILGRSTIWSGLDVRPIGCSKNVTIGKNVFINRNFRVAVPDPSKIVIENYVLIGPNVSIETVNHGLLWDEAIKGRTTQSQNVIIEQKSWIGAKATILGGVTIGRNSIVAAGAVVTKDVPPFTVAVGIPAKVVKKLI
jgi:acetyltransferase-like isoleucine patch superfamily enzyme